MRLFCAVAILLLLNPEKGATAESDFGYLRKMEMQLRAQTSARILGTSFSTKYSERIMKLKPRDVPESWIVIANEDKAPQLLKLFQKLQIVPTYSSRAFPGMFAFDSPNSNFCETIKKGSSIPIECTADREFPIVLNLSGSDGVCSTQQVSVMSELEKFVIQWKEKLPTQCSISDLAEYQARGIYKANASLNPGVSETTRFKEFGKIPRNWAQQLVGTDLLRMHREIVKPAMIPTVVGVNDSGFSNRCMANDRSGGRITNSLPTSYQNLDCANLDASENHGVHVHNIIFHERQGTEITGQATQVIFDYLDGKESEGGGETARRSLPNRIADFYQQNRVRIFNFSGSGIVGGDEEAAVFLRMQDEAPGKPGMIMVQSAGNFGPGPVEPNAVNNRAITVGSIDPDGIHSSYCNCQGALIAAPSADSIQAFVDSSGNSHRFGGTSGAAPVVTGLLANVIELTPDINRENLQRLMELTALPLRNQVPKMINGLKLFLAAEELQKKCLKGDRFNSCAKELIGAGEVANFSERAHAFEERANQLLLDGSSDCQSKQVALGLLRYSYMLDSKPAVAKKIADLFQSLGSPSMGTFYLNSASLEAPATPLKIRNQSR